MKTIIKAIIRPRKTWNDIKYWSIGKISSQTVIEFIEISNDEIVED